MSHHSNNDECRECVILLLAARGHGTQYINSGKEAIGKLQSILAGKKIADEEIDKQLGLLLQVLEETQNIKSPVEKEKIRVSDLAQKCLDALHKKYAGIQIELENESPDTYVFVNQHWLIYLVAGLVDNAVYAIRDQAERIVRMVIRKESQQLQWIIQDNGPGMSQEQFHQKINTRLADLQLSGRGLFLADTITGFYGGTLTMDGTGGGTKMIISLPFLE